MLRHRRLGEVGQIDRTVSLLDRQPTVAGQVVDGSRHPGDRPAGGVDVPRGSGLVSGLDSGELEIRPHDGERGAQLVDHFLRPAATHDIGGLDLRPGLSYDPSHPTGDYPGDDQSRDQGQDRRKETGVDETVNRSFLGHHDDCEVVTDLGNAGAGIGPGLVTHQERNGHHHYHQRQ